MNYRLLIINMGSTSTKVGVYSDTDPVWVQTITHPREEITRYLHFMDQYEYRLDGILSLLEEKGERLENFHGIVSRGGTIQPVSGGTYVITPKTVSYTHLDVYKRQPPNRVPIAPAPITATFIIIPPVPISLRTSAVSTLQRYVSISHIYYRLPSGYFQCPLG